MNTFWEIYIAVFVVGVLLISLAYTHEWWPFTDNDNCKDVWQGSPDDPRLLALLDEIEIAQWDDE